MGERFYQQQTEQTSGAAMKKRATKANAASKPKRRLKADIIADIEGVLGKSLPSLKGMTIVDLEYLLEYVSKE